jgi:hypothetical protein
MDSEQEKVWDILTRPERRGIMTIKPVVTASMLYNLSSGIHPDYGTRYERRTRESLGYIKDSAETTR